MTWKICIRGVVQGVGFRPFVWRAALEHNICGAVANGLEGVVVRINGTKQQAIDFQHYILENAPEMAHITHYSIEPETAAFFDSFTIEKSSADGLPKLLITPDVALCPACRAEIQDAGNRRFRYPFTTCTICGPRYSILRGVPYDRPQTTMSLFEMCNPCRQEYENPGDRRFFAQTNSCRHCGIQLRMFDCQTTYEWKESQHPFDPGKIMKHVVEQWQAGAIVAIKGIGGYLLTCDATNSTAIAALRQRKHRPSKPFALMYPDLCTLESDAAVTEAEAKQLQSAAAPIVLLELHQTQPSGIDTQGIAPGLTKIGAMLPNAPLFDLLLRDFGRPIVATSGNVSNAPLIYEDETAISQLSGIADIILMHDRDIVMPQDDSVVAMSTQAGRQHGGDTPPPVILRRARGLAPSFIQDGLQVPSETVLALGAEMKGAFALAHLNNLSISQYLGDLSDFEAQGRYQYTLHHLLEMFGAQPAVLTGDLHPGYYTTQLGRSIAEQRNIPFYQVQHHEAHFAAVLAENNLFEAGETPVLGVVWDGTGFGADGQVWGGEFFMYPGKQSPDARSFQRVAHFDYFPFLLGDKMPREPRLSAFSACAGLSAATDILRPKFTDTEWALYQKIARQPGPLMTSSVGRLFDAVASLLGLADKVTYEGEAALYLESLARRYCNRHGYDFHQGYQLTTTRTGHPLKISTTDLFEQIIQDLHSGKQTGFIAARFHFSMAKTVQEISGILKINKIAFSGGVFQNTLLLDMIQYHLGADCQLFFHRQLSPNDENIAFGQWAHLTGLKPTLA